MTATSLHSDAYRGYRFPGEVIAYTVWLYLRFPLSFRDVEELLATRGIQASYETVHCWVTKFGPQFAAELRKREARPGRVWHLDEMAVRIGGMSIRVRLVWFTVSSTLCISASARPIVADPA